MAGKKRSRLRIEREVRRRARQGIGLPPAGRVIADKRLKTPKHKKPLLEDDV